MILFSLIGEQPIPNLLPLWQQPERYSATRFAVTKTTADIAAQLTDCIRQDPALKHIQVLEPLELAPYDIGQARMKILHELTRHALQDETVCINLTGGTKVMSLAALQAAFGSGFPLLYVSTQTQEIIHYRSDGSETSREPLRVSISIEQYMRAHGLETSLHPNFNNAVGRPFAPPKEGDALEERVERLAVQSGYFDDVQRGLSVRKLRTDLEAINELDVVAIRNGRLVVCSCKTGTNWEKGSHALYEISALSRRESTGIYCGKVLVTDDEPREALLQRARLDGVRMVYGDKISQVADVMLEAAGIKPKDWKKEKHP